MVAERSIYEEYDAGEWRWPRREPDSPAEDRSEREDREHGDSERSIYEEYDEGDWR